MSSQLATKAFIQKHYTSCATRSTNKTGGEKKVHTQKKNKKKQNNNTTAINTFFPLLRATVSHPLVN